MASFKFKFLLIMLSIMSVVGLYLYIPASTLVWLSIVPALAFSVFTKRYFLVVISIAVFLQTILIFVAAMAGKADEVTETANILIYLYNVLYPYGFDCNLIALMGGHVIWLISVFIIFVVIIAWFTSFDEFRTMIAFSFFILMFTTFHLLVNIFSYLFPPLRDFMLSNWLMQWIIAFMYGILPFIVLVLCMMFLFTIYDYQERRQHKKDLAALVRRTEGRRVRTAIKWFAVLTFVIFLIVIIFAGVMQ
ncbi:MAG: hypothetical protein ACTSQI_06125 [Candidatus Helarchaeota archaeon]